ncbi:myosin-7-like isoform X1 [Branchiostoma lanceolatum]|uniref:myosin-7-like isoform X1 n=1 Tax=Branchiostoma lanceolatum TaxID=7740 RepID=UPI00345392B6
MMDCEKHDFMRYLAGDEKQLMALRNRPFDAKKVLFVPEKTEVWVEGEIRATKGDMVTVETVTKQTVTVKKDNTHPVNPPKFSLCDDMANLTYLHDASVLHNMRERYNHKLIYTYSGLFCVVINPYARLPIYKNEVIALYRSRRRMDVPPHLFAIADEAYRNMLEDRDNQSILITGESGAGKTENTKKVIAYFANVAALGEVRGGGGFGGKKATLEDQVVQTNPVLEAFGNAKTNRNNNSSRFGKFIRIHFGGKGKLAGADIETYLLEKSRVISQMPGERCYHVFYQLVSGAFPQYTEKLLLVNDAREYRYISEGDVTIAGVDDREEMRFTDEAFDILGFSNDEKIQVYRLVSGICHYGNMKFKERGEQAECDGMEAAEKVGHLFSVPSADMTKALLKPRVKVGNEYVVKGQTAQQCSYSVGALSKSIYNRLFIWLQIRLNETLATELKREYFIGVLDIAGFEIFELNSFEQLCINFTNEKLQQYFNHHMFVLEQEVYYREGIFWEFIDFGMDLQATINLIEKPLGIMSILEEECMFPKATDMTFKAKLNNNHAGKSSIFQTPKVGHKVKYTSDFAIKHYAATVNYNVAHWLEKNKDPINESVVEVLQKSTSSVMSDMFKDYVGSNSQNGEGKKPKKARAKKSAAFQTVSALHREQLNKLMFTLKNTFPHFVRCIIPNETKSAFAIDSTLVMHQLTCNGVLEGIRICRKGYPNRMPYHEFRQRYQILAPQVVAGGFVENKEATKKILEAIELESARFAMGSTMVFFKSAVVGYLEDLRDDILSRVMKNVQARARGVIHRKRLERMLEQREARQILQRNVRKWLKLRTWEWWRLYVKIKPLLQGFRTEEDLRAKEAELLELREKYVEEENLRKALERKCTALEQQSNDIQNQMHAMHDLQEDQEERYEMLVKNKASLQQENEEMKESLNELTESNLQLTQAKKKLDGDNEELKKDVEDLETSLSRMEQAKKAADERVHRMAEELSEAENNIKQLNRENKQLRELQEQTLVDLQAEEEKVNNLTKLKNRLAQQLEDMEESFHRQRKFRVEAERDKKKLEDQLRKNTESLNDLERAKSEQEDKIKKREFEIGALNIRLESEQSLVAQLQAKIKELMVRIEQLEADLEAERNARSKAEKAKNEAQRHLDDIGDRLEETAGQTSAQTESARKREAEILTLRRDMEAASAQHDSSMAELRRKHADQLRELQALVEALQRTKAKLEKEKNNYRLEVEDLAENLEQLTKQKVALEKQNRDVTEKLQEASLRLEEHARAMQEISGLKARLLDENTDLQRHLEEAERMATHLSRNKSMLLQQLEEMKHQLDDESKARALVSHQLRAAQQECDSLREQLEEEQEAKSETQRGLSKANTEVSTWRTKYETDAIQRTEELEEAKKKLAARLQEMEEKLEISNSRCSSLEKTKSRLRAENEDLMLDVEKTNGVVIQLEKKQRLVDKIISNWKLKCAEITAELEESRKENHALSNELMKLKTAYEEALVAMENLKKENKQLEDDVAGLNEAVAEGAKTISELDKVKKRLEVEKEELHTALEEAESSLEVEEGKVIRLNLELSQLKADIDRRLAEKEEEFEVTRKNQTRAIESLQASLEVESKGRAEALRAKKKLEGDLNECEVKLTNANRANAEARKLIGKLQDQVRDMQIVIDEEQRMRSELREILTVTERRAQAFAHELQETKSYWEASERGRKVAEAGLVEAHDRVGELSTQNSALVAAKRKLDAEVQQLQAEQEELQSAARQADDKAKKAMGDSARMAEDLRQEQDKAAHLEKVKRDQEENIRDLQRRLDEAETIAMKAGKRMIQKLETKVRELETSLASESKRHQDTLKNLRKNERRLKEMTFQSDEDRKNQERLQELVEKLQLKIKTYKRQTEEAAETATSSLTRYRQTQNELEDVTERADIAEGALAKMRAKYHGTTAKIMIQKLQQEE